MTNKTHSQSCRACKESVRCMLSVLYGKVEVNWQLDLPCRVENMRHTSYYGTLHKIHDALRKHRNYGYFVRARKLPKVDFFVPSRDLIVEFDESQHFTKPREIALGFYPPDLKVLFPVYRWRVLCRELNKRDNDPPYRDEQRAWYDTLRDFAPALLGKGEVARLYARDMVWCSLDPKNKSDIRRFRGFLMGNSESK